jgi:hypothetical protein
MILATKVNSGKRSTVRLIFTLGGGDEVYGLMVKLDCDKE